MHKVLGTDKKVNTVTNPIKRLCVLASGIATIVSLVCVGCGAVATEEPIIMVDASPDEIVYKLEEISVGDVRKTERVSCEYVQTKQQEVAFDVGGKIIYRVHVKNGDKVAPGDLLVELEDGDIEDQIALLEYQISKNELMLGYLDKAEEFDMQNSYFSLVYDSGKTEDDVKDKEKRDESIAEDYTYQREDIEDNLEFDRRKLEKLKGDLAANRIYATMAGKVINVKKDLEGTTAKRGDVIMNIVDNENGIFESKDTEAASYFQDGVTVPMSISYGDAKGDYELMPYNMSSWGETEQFSIVDRPEGSTIEVGCSGTITATSGMKQSVNRIPLSALYTADDKYYTYVLDEDNMKNVVFIEIGLIGDDYAEVLGGIEVGTKVVRR